MKLTARGGRAYPKEMRRTFAMASVVLLLLVSVRGEARPKSVPRVRPSSFFLSGDPHVPLAVIVGGRVQEAVSPRVRNRWCGAKSRWRRVGTRWNALDKWGQVGATRTVTAKDDYDVTGCAELAFGGARD